MKKFILIESHIRDMKMLGVFDSQVQAYFEMERRVIGLDKKESKNLPYYSIYNNRAFIDFQQGDGYDWQIFEIEV